MNATPDHQPPPEHTVAELSLSVSALGRRVTDLVTLQRTLLPIAPKEGDEDPLRCQEKVLGEFACAVAERDLIGAGLKAIELRHLTGEKNEAVAGFLDGSTGFLSWLMGRSGSSSLSSLNALKAALDEELQRTVTTVERSFTDRLALPERPPRSAMIEHNLATIGGGTELPNFERIKRWLKQLHNFFPETSGYTHKLFEGLASSVGRFTTIDSFSFANVLLELTHEDCTQKIPRTTWCQAGHSFWRTVRAMVDSGFMWEVTHKLSSATFPHQLPLLSDHLTRAINLRDYLVSTIEGELSPKQRASIRSSGGGPVPLEIDPWYPGGQIALNGGIGIHQNCEEGGDHGAGSAGSLALRTALGRIVVWKGAVPSHIFVPIARKLALRTICPQRRHEFHDRFDLIHYPQQDQNGRPVPPMKEISTRDEIPGVVALAIWDHCIEKRAPR